MESKTRIFRHMKRSHFSIIHNEVVRRSDISWKAKGIMVYILSLPDDWVIYLEEVAKHATDGMSSFRTGWDELKAKGYVKRSPIREKGKIVAWRTEVFESVGNVDISTFPPHVDFQQVEKPHVENRKLLSTDITKDLYNKDIVVSRNDNVSENKQSEKQIDEIVDYLNKVSGKQFRKTTKNTRSKVRARMAEGFSVDDFKSVIDVKSKQWLNDGQMEKYLRPETLFGNRFESYLNEAPKKKEKQKTETFSFDTFFEE